MVEQEELVGTPEQNIVSVAKAAVVLFPDTRTTGGENRLKDYTPILYQDFRSVTEKLLKRYQRLGFTTVGIVYEDTNSETFSYLYPQGLFQNIIRVGAFNSWGNDEKFTQFYENCLPDILKKLNPKKDADIVVGGFHAKDCIAKFTAFLKRKGFKARIDLRLTNELPFLLISHKLKNMLPQEMVKEHVREDNLTWGMLKEELEAIIDKQV